MNISDLAARAAAGQPLSGAQAEFVAAHVAALPDDLANPGLQQLLDLSLTIKRSAFGDALSFCSILSTKGGPCGEDCAFCAQSGHAHGPAAPAFEFLGLETILEAARAARRDGATRFSLVTSGKSLSEADFAKLLQAVAAVRAEGLAADVSPGVLSRERLAALQAAGAGAYHHNLETGPSFYAQVCSTRTWEENRDCVRHAVDLGLAVCSGGLFGMGETWADRLELALALRDLGVHSVPVNFLHPMSGTRLEHRPVLSAAEALKIIALLRLMLPQRHIRVCGGRHTVFAPDEQALVFTSGASGIMVGDYLTLKGRPAGADAALAASLGLRPESSS